VLALLTAVALSQTPVALVQSSNFGVPAQRISDLTRALAEVIDAAKLVPVAATSPCEKRACIFTTARQLKARVVISLAFASVGKDTLVDAEALDVNDEKSLAQATLKAPSATSLQAGETSKFVAALKDAIAALAAADKPKEAIEPHNDAAPPPVDVTPPKQPEENTGHSHAPSFVLAALSAVGLGVGVTCGALGLSNINEVYGPYNNNEPVQHTRAASQVFIDQGNTFYKVADVSYAVAGALFVTAVLLFILQ
jgi:hypothetical protein